MKSRLELGLAITAAMLCAPGISEGFCGFYVSGAADRLLNNATEVALMRQGTRTVLSMANHYQGPATNFAMVVPVPVVLQQANVKTLPKEVFDHLDQLTSPRLVEYWEIDPCYTPPPMPRNQAMYPGSPPTTTTSSATQGSYGVRIEAQFTVGEYEVLVLSADQSNGLERYLHDNHYNIPNGAASVLEPYVRDQWKFFVAKVDIQKVTTDSNGVAELSPLRFHYDSQDFRLPVRLGLLNAADAQDLIVYVLSENQRFEVTNYPNVFIPTNLHVEDSVKAQFPQFYTQLFEATLASAGARAVVTEYAWTTNSCDPCPGPPMASGEMATLGGDVLLGNANAATPSYSGFTVTRLHTRYNATTLTEDLVFREAPAVLGGREFATNANGEIEQGAIVTPGGTNNFQARYIIRHPWAGAVRCAHPVRGRWGGPPGSGPGSAPQSSAAPNLNTAPRGAAVNLPAVVKTPTPGVDLNARLTFSAQVAQNTSPSDAGAQANTAAADGGSGGSSGGGRPPASRGCACRSTRGSAEGVGSGTLIAGALGMALGRRRKGQSPRRKRAAG